MQCDKDTSTEDNVSLNLNLNLSIDEDEESDLEIISDDEFMCKQQTRSISAFSWIHIFKLPTTSEASYTHGSRSRQDLECLQTYFSRRILGYLLVMVLQIEFKGR